MDAIQTKVFKAINSNKKCLSDRIKLKGILSDVIPAEKRQINLLLNAYDEEIIRRMSTPDLTLAMLKLISILMRNYGISEENARWSVCTWCYIFERQDVGDALTAINKSSPEIKGESDFLETSREGVMINIKPGVYRAGTDIPSGLLKASSVYGKAARDAVSPRTYWKVSPELNEVCDNICLNEYGAQGYIEINNGDYLRLDSLGYFEIENIVIEKMAESK